jgi:hypothetical protein
MADREADRAADQAHYESIMADINELVRRGLVVISDDERVAVTDKGFELLNNLNAQTWS